MATGNPVVVSQADLQVLQQLHRSPTYCDAAALNDPLFTLIRPKALLEGNTNDPDSAQLSKLERLLKVPGINVNIRQVRTGRTPLHVASQCGDYEAVQLLLNKGADIGAQDDVDEATPLHLACEQKGDTRIIQLLLLHGADVETLTRNEETTLHVACKVGNYQAETLLIQHGASVKAMDVNGRIPAEVLPLEAKITKLVLACSCGDETVSTQRLGIQSDLVDRQCSLTGETPLTASCKAKNSKIAEYLLLKHAADPNMPNAFSATPLEIALDCGCKTLLKLLLQCEADHKPIMKRSIEEQNTSAVAILLDCGVDVDEALVDQQTPLHLACVLPSIPVVLLLLDHAANVDARCNGQSSLHAASQVGNVSIVSALLRHGAVANSTDDSHMTPMHIACLNGNNEVVRELIAVGADPAMENYVGETPLDLVKRAREKCPAKTVSYNEIEQMLEQAMEGPEAGSGLFEL